MIVEQVVLVEFLIVKEPLGFKAVQETNSEHLLNLRPAGRPNKLCSIPLILQFGLSHGTRVISCLSRLL